MAPASTTMAFSPDGATITKAVPVVRPWQVSTPVTSTPAATSASTWGAPSPSSPTAPRRRVAAPARAAATAWFAPLPPGERSTRSARRVTPGAGKPGTCITTSTLIEPTTTTEPIAPRRVGGGLLMGGFGAVGFAGLGGGFGLLGPCLRAEGRSRGGKPEATVGGKTPPRGERRALFSRFSCATPPGPSGWGRGRRRGRSSPLCSERTRRTPTAVLQELGEGEEGPVTRPVNGDGVEPPESVPGGPY